MSKYIQKDEFEKFLRLLHEKASVNELTATLKPDFNYFFRNLSLKWTQKEGKIHVSVLVDVTLESWVFFWPKSPGEDGLRRCGAKVYGGGLLVSGNDISLRAKSGEKVTLGDASLMFEVTTRKSI